MFNPFANFIKKNKPVIETPVLFHKEANGLPEHGVLCATHVQLKITKNDAVRFTFKDIDPPALTAEVLAHITDQAERKGYIVHNLHSYAGVATLVPAPVLRPRSEQPAPVLDQRHHEPRGVARTMRRPSGPRAQEQGRAG